MTTLLTPATFGDLHLPNRIVMAPLTRARAAEGRVPTDLNAEYYAQRASAGLILSEATSVTPMGVGYPDTPGLWSEAQVAGWRKVTSAVHAKGGRIVAQLWHVGRISHTDYFNGAAPVSSSDVQAAGHAPLKRPKAEYSRPRALRIDEIPGLLADFAKGAENALKAGFDGVELHAANGYLIEQFLADKTNKRDDAYGGSIENRVRLLLEVTDAIVKVAGAGRTGVHLSPRMSSNDSGSSDATAVTRHAIAELARRRLAFLFIREHEGDGAHIAEFKRIFGGNVIANEGFTVQTAEKALAEGNADAVAWGRAFIANPDLVDRIRTGAAWNEVNPQTFYGVGGLGPVGYTDYPALSEQSAA